jgi:hypothetical protein
VTLGPDLDCEANSKAMQQVHCGAYLADDRSCIKCGANRRRQGQTLVLISMNDIPLGSSVQVIAAVKLSRTTAKLAKRLIAF